MSVMESNTKDQQQVDMAEVLNLRKMMNCLEQHNGLQLADAVPSLMEALNMNCAAFKSLNINSLVQIGYYVMEEGNVHHKENNEYISRLVSVLLNSVVNENKEMRVMRDKFLFAVWCRTDTISLPLHLHERITLKWKLYLQRIILDLIVTCHAVRYNQYQQYMAEIFASPDTIFFLDICRRSPLIFQATIMIFTTFLIYKKGCSVIRSVMKEFIKLVKCYSKEGLCDLFPPRYKLLVSFLQQNPDFSEHDVELGEIKSSYESDDLQQFKVLELLITTFREDKYSGVVLIGCFPVWLPFLVKYYFKKYNTNFFTDFHF